MAERAQVKPVSQADDVADTLRSYGITAPGIRPLARPAEAQGDDVGTVLKEYGVTVPNAQAPDPRTAAPPSDIDPGDLSRTKPGKIPPPAPERASRTKDVKAAAEGRGLGRVFTSAIPIAGPLVDLSIAARTAQEDPSDKPFAEKFSEALHRNRQAGLMVKEDRPVAATLAELGGSALGYGALANRFPALFGMTGPTLGSRVWMGAGGQGGVGALDAALRGEDALMGLTVGAAGGALGPVVGRGAEVGTNAVASYAWPRPGPLRDVPVAGIRALTNALEGETPQSLAAARARTGPAGFLGDLTQPLTDLTGAISDLPGAGKSIVRQAYRDRAEQAPMRIARALDSAMGPNTNIVQHGRFLAEARAAAADPLYEQWRTMQVHPTRELQALIPRLERAGAFTMAEELAGISGHPLNRNFFVGGPRKSFPTTETWDYVKRGLDRRIDQAYAAGDNNLARELNNLRGQLIHEIGQTPAGHVWRQARQEFASRSALIDQLNAGRDTFIGGRAGLSVDELREELQHLSGPELAARIQGMRSATAEAMGERIGGEGSLRNKLLAPNNQEKIRLMLGDVAGRRLINDLESERVIANVTPAILPNYHTGASAVDRSRRGQLLQPPTLPEWDLDLTRPFSWIPPSFKPHNVLQAMISQRAGEVPPRLAPLMVTSEGPQMDALIASLMAERDRVARVARSTERGGRAISGLIAGPGQAEYRRQTERKKEGKEKKD